MSNESLASLPQFLRAAIETEAMAHSQKSTQGGCS